MPNMTTLILGRVPATDESLENLAPMKILTDLELHDTKITDAGLKRLGALTALVDLTVPHTISDKAVDELKGKLPKLKVTKIKSDP
jgi:hypothetical protein